MWKARKSGIFLYWTGICTFSCWNSTANPDVTHPLLFDAICYIEDLPQFLVFSYLAYKRWASLLILGKSLPFLNSSFQMMPSHIFNTNATGIMCSPTLPFLFQRVIDYLCKVLQDQSWCIIGKLLQPGCWQFPGFIHPLFPYGHCGWWPCLFTWYRWMWNEADPICCNLLNLLVRIASSETTDIVNY